MTIDESRNVDYGRVKGATCVLSFCFGLAIFSMCAGAEYTLSPEEAFDAKVGALKPGDVLVVKKGVHKSGWTIGGLKGTARKPIVIRGEKGAVLKPAREREGIIFWGGGGSSHVVIENLAVRDASRAGIIVSGSHNITIRGCTISNNGVWGVQTCLSDYVTVEDCEIHGSVKEHGVYFSTTDHPVVRNCTIRDNAGCGIHMNGDKSEGGDGLISHGVLEGNIIYRHGRNGGAGINMDGVENTVVRNNLLYENLSGGIVSFVQNGLRSGSGNRFEGNTVVFNRGQGRFGLSFIGGSKSIIARRNILVCGKGPAVLTDAVSLSGLLSDNNVYWTLNGTQPFVIGEQRVDLKQWRALTGQDESSMRVRPIFKDPENGDYALNTELSPAGLSAGWKGSRRPVTVQKRNSSTL
jgi:parallel beta-helix repeat protein